MIEADAGNDDDTRQLAVDLARRYGAIDYFVDNVCVAARGSGLAGMRKRDLAQSLQASSWPLLTYLDALEQACGRLPAVTVAMSSDGPDHYYPGYEYVAVSKAALEALVQAVGPRLAASDARIFGLRTRQVGTQSLDAMFGPAMAELLTARFSQYGVAPDKIGQAVMLLCGGLLNGLHAQTITIDKGAAFFDNFVAIAPLLREIAA
jgi:enoyl-[acyl-carrier-protein] reductase (NADH)